MAEIIKLKVPKDGVTTMSVVIDRETKERKTIAEAVDSLTQGNFSAIVAPNAIIETESRAFADWLILNYGLTEIKPKKTEAEAAAENPFAADYAPDFPGRDAFIAAEIPLETVRGLTREQMVKVPGIGGATADAALNYQSAPLVLPFEAATAAETGELIAAPAGGEVFSGEVKNAENTQAGGIE